MIYQKSKLRRDHNIKFLTELPNCDCLRSFVPIPECTDDITIAQVFYHEGEYTHAVSLDMYDVKIEQGIMPTYLGIDATFSFIALLKNDTLEVIHACFNDSITNSLYRLSSNFNVRKHQLLKHNEEIHESGWITPLCCLAPYVVKT